MQNVKKNLLRSVYSLVLLVTIFGLSACSVIGKKKAETEQPEQAVVDMTRPPQTITGAKLAIETNPDEEVSFEKWKDERTKELEKTQQAPE